MLRFIVATSADASRLASQLSNEGHTAYPEIRLRQSSVVVHSTDQATVIPLVARLMPDAVLEDPLIANPDSDSTA